MPDLKNLEVLLTAGWAKQLESEFSKSYMENIRTFLKSEINAGYRFFPSSHQIFSALKAVDYNDTRVVIIGQDPYHGFGQANGLAFAVEADMRIPPSLQNIFKEIQNSLNLKHIDIHMFDRTLISWAKQGVLCLNTVLTVRENLAFSHRKHGWESFTDKVIEVLLQKSSPIVFLCWGAAAAKKVENIKILFKKKYGMVNTISHSHLILKAPHPSPLSAHRGFLGCNHFIKANKFLQKKGFSKIEWFCQTTTLSNTN